MERKRGGGREGGGEGGDGMLRVDWYAVFDWGQSRLNSC